MNNLSANILRPRYRTCWIKLLGNCVTNEQGKPFELCTEIIVSWTNHFSVHPNNNVSILCTYCAPITHDIYLSIIDKQCVQIVDMITFRLHWLGHHLHQDWSPYLFKVSNYLILTEFLSFLIFFSNFKFEVISHPFLWELF